MLLQCCLTSETQISMSVFNIGLFYRNHFLERGFIFQLQEVGFSMDEALFLGREHRVKVGI